MKGAIIRLYHLSRDASRRVAGYHFAISAGSEETFVHVLFTYRLLSSWGIRDDKHPLPVPSRVALARLTDMVRLREVPADNDIEVLLTGDDAALEKPQWKECNFQQQEAAGLKCTVAHERDPAKGVTTRVLCESCGLPSTDILCDNLVYPKTVGDGTEPDRVKSRSLVAARCDIESTEFEDARKCIPGGYSCWTRTVQLPAAAAATAGDLAVTLVGMIDVLNMIVNDNYAQGLFRLKQARTVRSLTQGCTNEDEFTARLQAIGDLIDLIDAKSLNTSVSVTASAGSINQLEAFLNHQGVSGLEPIIQPLRDIKKVRTLYSHSAASRNFREACARLGIPLPIDDFPAAWHALLSTMVAALRQLQAALP